MKSRFGYEMQPATFDELVESARGQVAAQDDPTFNAGLDGVTLTAKAFLELLERIEEMGQ